MTWVGVVFIQDSKVLMVREDDKDFFVFPGGRLDEGESAETALYRELNEELGVSVDNLVPFGTYDLPGKAEGTMMHFILYSGDLSGTIAPQGDIAELKWVDSSYLEQGIPVGHLASMYVFSELKERNLVS
jgi:8-oxo-dGTP diphosphatase